MYFASRWTASLLLITALALSCLRADAQTQPRPSFQPPRDVPKYAPDRLLVRFRPGVAKGQTDRLHANLRTAVVKSYTAVNNLQMVRLPPGASLAAALSNYRKDPSVIYAEPDYVVHVLQNPVTPNDPRFAEMWGLHNTGQSGGGGGEPGTPGADIHAPQAWSLSTGSSNVVVGLIDTGIDYTHEDLSANMFRNPLDCNNNGIDDDGDGFIDDCYGIDTVNDDSDPMDDNGHGTHVAGTIGASGNNGVGVIGVNWNVKLIACKFLDENGSGFASDAINCLEYMAAMKDRGVNIVATNNSWGGSGFSQALLDAIDSQRQRGILFIAAAGNIPSNNDGTAFPSYPASYYLPNIISVEATDRWDYRAGFSAFGRHSVHLGAPGRDILSTTPGNTYSVFTGTSMAAPHVTGVAALLAAQDATRDWKAIKNLLLASGDEMHPFDIDLTPTISNKRLNAYRALTCTNSPLVAPLQPRDSTAAAIGLPVNLAVLNINCANPNGNVSVLVDGGVESIGLLDDGLGTDQEAGDGIYSGQWTPTAAGSHTLAFPGGDILTVRVLSRYRFPTEVGFNYRYISGNDLRMNADWEQIESALIGPGFPILFGGGSFGALWVNDNGSISFTEPYSHPADRLPTAGTPTLVAPFWGDIYPHYDNHGGVFWDVIGGAPNRELVIEWRDVPQFDCQDSYVNTVRFQVVFFEGSSDILFNYADATFGPPCEFADLGAAATVGVQVAPSLATQFSSGTPSLRDNTSLLWQWHLGAEPEAALNPTSMAFNDQLVGAVSGTSDVRLTNSGTETLNVNSITLTGTDASQFALVAPASGSPACSLGAGSIAPGNSCFLAVKFQPNSIGVKSASVSVADDAHDSPHTVALSGSGIVPGPVANFIPASVSFSNQLVGTASGASNVRLTNSGTATLHVTSITLAGSDVSQFALVAPSSDSLACSLGASSIDPGNSCFFGVKFQPNAIGAKSASVSVAGDPSGSPHTVVLSGTGIVPAPAWSFHPTSVPFDNQLLGTASSTMDVQLASTGTATLHVTSITLTGSDVSQFALVAPSSDSLACSLGASSIDPGNFCFFGVKFQPTSGGSKSASVSVADDASGSPHTVVLSGTGIVPVPDVRFSSDSITFDGQFVGATSGQWNVQLLNVGTGTLQISSITLTGSDSSQFHLVTVSGNPPECFLSSFISPNSGCYFAVEFRPTSPGAKSAVVSVASNAPGSPHTVNLSANASDFAVAGPPQAVALAAGGTGNFEIDLSTAGAPTLSSITFSATGNPAHTTVTFNPPSIPAGSATASTTMTIATTARSNGLPLAPSGSWPQPLPLFYSILCFVFGWSVLVLKPRRLETKKLIGAYFLFVAALTLAALSGCAGGSGGGTTGGGTTGGGTTGGGTTGGGTTGGGTTGGGTTGGGTTGGGTTGGGTTFGTPAGTSTITVTATSAATFALAPSSRTTTVQLTVQ